MKNVILICLLGLCVIVSNSIKNSKDITEYIASINKQD
jgi:hypothetical protein